MPPYGISFGETKFVEAKYMTVCYFTASGNCLYVARRIGGVLLSIPQLMRKETIQIDDDAVGVPCI